MASSPNTDFNAFRSEIIRRFFHPKSYFFLCLSTQLQDTSNIAVDVTDDDYLIIGQLMQVLIESTNPEEVVRKLGEIERLDDFCYSLDEGLFHLRQPGLSPEDMKRTIEGMAHELVEALVDVLHNDQLKRELSKVLVATHQSAEVDEKVEPILSVPDTDAGIESEQPEEEQPIAPFAMNLSELDENSDSPVTQTEMLPDAEAVSASDRAPLDDDLLRFPEIAEETPEAATGAEIDNAGLDDAWKEWTDDATAADAELLVDGDGLQGSGDRIDELKAFEIGHLDSTFTDEVFDQDLEHISFPPQEIESSNGNHLSPGQESLPPYLIPVQDGGDPATPLVDAANSLQAEASAADEPKPDDIEKEPQPSEPEPMAMRTVNPEASTNTDGIDEASYSNALAKEADRPIAPVALAQKNDHDGLPRAPEALRSAFFNEARDLIDKTAKTVALLQVNKSGTKHLKSLLGLFLNLRESGMIHGFEELEDLAFKAYRLTERIIKSQKALSASLIALFAEIPRQMELALGDTLDRAANGSLLAFATEMMRAVISPFQYERNKASGIAGHEQKIDPERVLPGNGLRTAEPREKADSKIPDSIIDPENTKTIEADITAAFSEQEGDDGHDIEPYPLDAALPLAESDTEIADDDLSLELPGEDDPDLLQLIKEVSDHRTGANQKPSRVNEEKRPITVDKGTESALAKAKAMLFRIETLPRTTNESILSFRNDSELYFRVIDEALQKLVANGRDRGALEDLELAAYSLKGLVRKLGLEQLARFPELVEELVRKLIYLGLSCSEKPVETIQKGFSLLRRVADISDVERGEYHELEKNLLRLIHSLNEFTPNNVNEQARKKGPTASPAKNARPGLDKYEEKTGQFRLRGRDFHTDSDPNDRLYRNNQQNSGKRGLDFLMNGDADLPGLDD